MTPTELKQIRTLLGWSQARLAEELGVRRQTVTRWENGQAPIDKRTALLMSLWRDALGPR